MEWGESISEYKASLKIAKLLTTKYAATYITCLSMLESKKNGNKIGRRNEKVKIMKVGQY